MSPTVRSLTTRAISSRGGDGRRGARNRPGTGTVRTAQSPIRPVSARPACHDGDRPAVQADPHALEDCFLLGPAARRGEQAGPGGGSRRRASSSAGRRSPPGAAAGASSSRCSWTSTPTSQLAEIATRPTCPLAEQLTERAAEVLTIGRPASSISGTAAGGGEQAAEGLAKCGPEEDPPAAHGAGARPGPPAFPLDQVGRGDGVLPGVVGEAIRHTHAPGAAPAPGADPVWNSGASTWHTVLPRVPSAIAELDQTVDHRLGGARCGDRSLTRGTDIVPRSGCPTAHSAGTRPEVRRLPAVSLRLFDTAARAVRDFTPLRAGRASVYVCGFTVQRTSPRRPRPRRPGVRRAAPLAHRPRPRRHLHPQRHRHRRQDPRQGRGERRPRRAGRTTTSAPARGPTTSSASCRPRYEPSNTRN